MDETFNAITVDSDTSTSDTLILAATGQSAAAEITARSPVAKAFEAALRGVMLDLAHQVVRDGEGATKFVEIRVTGAADGRGRASRRHVHRQLAAGQDRHRGQDPNWGRIVAAIGKSGAEADRDRLSIRFGDILVAEKGWRAPELPRRGWRGLHEAAGPRDRRRSRARHGRQRTVWTCDLTHRYIDINADYRS